MGNQINDPKIGSSVRHTGFHWEDNENYPCNVKIIRGCFLDPVHKRVSNWWSWKRILPDGGLSETESGYGSFEEIEKSH